MSVRGVRLAFIVLFACGTFSDITAAPGLAFSQGRTTYTQLGPGATDCGVLTSDIRKNRDEWESFYTVYLQGFITGANFYAATVSGPPSVEASHPALLAALEQYCAANPLNKVADGAVNIYLQLVRKR